MPWILFSVISDEGLAAVVGGTHDWTSRAMVLILGILTWYLLVSISNVRQHIMQHRKTTWKPRASIESSAYTTRRQFLIDGSNGPLYLDKTHLKDVNEKDVTDKNIQTSTSSSEIHMHLSVSQLHVINGESQEERTRIHIIPRLDQLLARGDILEHVTIFFDGRGKKTIAGRSWDVSPHVKIQITDISDEADDVIVDQVETLELMRRNKDTDTDCDNNDDGFECDLFDNILHSDPKSSASTCLPKENVYTITRTSDGPGKSRNALKYLQLIRRESVFCLFAFVPELQSNALSVAKRLVGAKKLIHVKRRNLSMDASIVVSDDVLLRQRVVDAGGFVMTFEQMWELLNSVKED